MEESKLVENQTIGVQSMINPEWVNSRLFELKIDCLRMVERYKRTDMGEMIPKSSEEITQEATEFYNFITSNTTK